MDEIRIEHLEVYAYHGVYPQEQKKGQEFLIDAVLRLDTRTAGRADDLALTVNYGEVCHFMAAWMKNNRCDLIEAVADKLAEAVLLEFPLLEELELEIRKPEAPVGLPFRSISVRIVRGWHRAYLSLGSNIGDREAHLRQGIAALEENPLIRVQKVSEMLNTKPYGGVEQDDFLNMALCVRTLLTPAELLEQLHEIEAAEGRERNLRWGPRTLDMDILFYDRLVYEDDALVIPHVDLQNRYFVLKPLNEIAPNLRHSILGKTVAQMLAVLEGDFDGR